MGKKHTVKVGDRVIYAHWDDRGNWYRGVVVSHATPTKDGIPRVKVRVERKGKGSPVEEYVIVARTLLTRLQDLRERNP